MSVYDDDPRVRVDGSGGYTVTTEDLTLRILYDPQHGWGVHNEDGQRLHGGHSNPDALIHTLIGAPHRHSGAKPSSAKKPDRRTDEDPPRYRDAGHLRKPADRCEAGGDEPQRATDDQDSAEPSVDQPEQENAMSTEQPLPGPDVQPPDCGMTYDEFQDQQASDTKPAGRRQDAATDDNCDGW